MFRYRDASGGENTEATAAPAPHVVIKQWVRREDAPVDENDLPSEEAARDAKTADEIAQEEEQRQREEAKKIIEKAQIMAKDIYDKAIVEAQGMKQAAWQQGYEEGVEQAAQEEEQRATEYKQAFDEFLKSIQQQREQANAMMEENILRLSVDIAQKVVNIQFEKDDTIFVGIVKAAVQRLNAKEKFTIYLNQKEYDRFFAEGTGWLEECMQSAPFSVVADASVPPGGIKLQSALGGTVDAGVKTQIGNIERALKDR
ncbi:hypothetical protein LJB83_01055 [Clostridia bacterium OttesenSCG-928-F22]|nr:hypothetical protein [Clostridia bacterium OttesenSCG-928-F22]